MEWEVYYFVVVSTKKKKKKTFTKFSSVMNLVSLLKIFWEKKKLERTLENTHFKDMSCTILYIISKMILIYYV